MNRRYTNMVEEIARHIIKGDNLAKQIANCYSNRCEIDLGKLWSDAEKQAAFWEKTGHWEPEIVGTRHMKSYLKH